MRTQVGIVGAGPAGLMLSHLLHVAGIESVIIEARSRQYAQERVRAGVLEQGTVDLLIETGVGERLKREGLTHHGIELRFGGRAHRIDFQDLANGRAVTIYPQHKVVGDLIEARLAAGGQIIFEAEDVSVHDFEGMDSGKQPAKQPKIRFRTAGGEPQEVICDYIAGCDGFHGVCRPSIPASALTFYERIYPFAWLGILAEAPPSREELIYAYHERGFALLSMRSPTIGRLYLSARPTKTSTSGRTSASGSELHLRLATVRGLEAYRRPHHCKRALPGCAALWSEPMQFGRLFLAGDAAHIVPPTGAKGMNLAISDVRVLAGLCGVLQYGRRNLLEDYSQIACGESGRCSAFPGG